MCSQPATAATYFDERIDIHHIFPQHWCRQNDVPPALCDSIVNKIPLSARTNRVIGGRAPSEYVSRLQNSADISAGQLDDHLRTHLIDPDHLRTNDFMAFFERRQFALLQRIGEAMGKSIETGLVADLDDTVTEYQTDAEAVFDDDNVEAIPA